MDELKALKLPPDAKKRIAEWLGDEYDPATREEITGLIREKNAKELLDRFFTDLEFGTGGLRGIMGAGSNRMNPPVIARASQGLANYLRKKYKKNIKAVVAYDSRNRSREFALKTALIFAGNGIHTSLFTSLRPTPVLSFTVRHLKAHAGVVITASHNPPEYNGYKVFGHDGGQIVFPEDERIIREVRKVVRLSSVRELPEKEALGKKLLEYIDEGPDEAYLREIRTLSLALAAGDSKTDAFRIVYTPLHGSGGVPVKRALFDLGFKNVFIVKEQEAPDGNFPTVPSPNPEEPSALKLGLALCEKTTADILLATDPDSDRLGTAVRNGKGGYELLTGNQVVSLLTHYILSRMKEQGRLPENGMVIKTIVTTDLMRRIADDFRIRTVEVLTGFKYIGEQIRIQEEKKEKGRAFLQYIFGGEESYGMLAGTFVRDKDAVSAAVLFAEMASSLREKGQYVPDYLDRIYGRYGYFRESLKSLTLKGVDGLSRIQRIMETFRKKAPEAVCGISLERTADFKKRTLKEARSGKVLEKILLPVSDVITLFFENNVKITMRPSGTEPKIKFYFSIGQKECPDLAKAKEEVDGRIRTVMDGFLKIVDGIIRA